MGDTDRHFLLVLIPGSPLPMSFISRRLMAATLAGALVASTAAGAPLPTREVSDDVGFSQGAQFNGVSYGRLLQPRVRHYEDQVIVLVYFTPW